MGNPGEHHHWFLGDGMVHGVRLVDGEAKWYRNRYVRSNAVVAQRLGEPSRARTGRSATSPPTPM